MDKDIRQLVSDNRNEFVGMIREAVEVLTGIAGRSVHWNRHSAWRGFALVIS